jgi:hypothetical protein
MNVYAPTDEALVLFAGRDKQSSLRSVLERIVGALAVLLPMSAGVVWLARQLEPGQSPESAGGEAPVDAGSTPQGTPTPDGGVSIMKANETTPTPTPENLSTVTDPATSGLDPALVAGLAFFLGGAFVLVWLWAWRRRQ